MGKRGKACREETDRHHGLKKNGQDDPPSGEGGKEHSQNPAQKENIDERSPRPDAVRRPPGKQVGHRPHYPRKADERVGQTTIEPSLGRKIERKHAEDAKGAADSGTKESNHDPEGRIVQKALECCGIG